MSDLKTQTLSYDDSDEPAIVICQGHVDAETFNKAFKNEGWSDESDYTDEMLTHGYGYFTRGIFRCFPTKEKPHYEPYTYVDWD